MGEPIGPLGPLQAARATPACPLLHNKCESRRSPWGRLGTEGRSRVPRGVAKISIRQVGPKCSWLCFGCSYATNFIVMKIVTTLL